MKSQFDTLRQTKVVYYIVYHVYSVYFRKYIMKNAGLEEAQAGIKIAERNSNNFRYADDTTLVAESEEELKSLLMKVKEESEKVGLMEKEMATHSIIRAWRIPWTEEPGGL